MTQVFSRIMKKKIESKMGWDEIAKKAHIRLSTWMTGIPTDQPSDDDLKKLAPVLNTTYEYLKYGN